MGDAADSSKLPPHSIKAESAVLGCGLSSVDCLPQILSLKSESAFYDARHKIIFATFAAMHRDGVPIDLITVQQRLKDADLLEQIGGIPYLSEIQDVHSTANLPAWVEIVRQKWAKRKIIQTFTGVIRQIDEYDGTLDDLKISIDSGLAEVFGNTAGDLPELIDATDFLAQPIDPPAELVAGILHKGSKLVFGGSSKSFKTWCLLDFAISVAAGVAWMGRATAQGKVLFVNFEIQPHPWQQRIAKVAKAKGVETQPGQIHLWNLRGHAADFRRLIPRIIQRARREGFALIVLDPIYKLYGGTDENAAGDVAELLNSLETLAMETGAAIAFGAHFAKGNPSAKEAIDRISGSGVFARDPDSLLIFTKHETADAFTVEPILRNFPPVSPFAVRWQPPLMIPADDLDPAKLKQVGGRKAEHSPADLLDLLPRDGMENKAWIATAAENGISRRTFFRLRKELQKSGKVRESVANGEWFPVLKQ